MTLLPRPSVSPLPSYAARPDFAPRPVSTIEALKAITAWLRCAGPDWRQRFREAQLVERLAEEMRQAEEAEAEAADPEGHKGEH
jgi:hypothetical protein